MIKLWLMMQAMALPPPSPAAAQARAPAPIPTVAELRATLEGEWTGALGYRDYQSNRLFELEVRSSIRSVGDGVTQIRTSRFDEGPRRPAVWTTTVSAFLGSDPTLTSTFFRAGRPAESQSERVTLSRYSGPTDWSIVYSQTGTDDDRPAEIRVTETLHGDELLAVKEVRPVGPQGGAWAFRNQLRLRRVRSSLPASRRQ